MGFGLLTIGNAVCFWFFPGARRASAHAAKDQRREHLAKEAEKKKVEAQIRAEAQLKLAGKLETLRRAREAEMRALEEEEAKIAKKRMFLGAAAAMVEEKAHEELLKGAQREARTRQERVQREATVREGVKAKDTALGESNRRRARRERRQKQAAAERRIEVARKHTAERQHELIQEKKRTVRGERRRADHARTKLAGRNQYATDISELSLTRGRADRARRERARARRNKK